MAATIRVEGLAHSKGYNCNTPLHPFMCVYAGGIPEDDSRSWRWWRLTIAGLRVAKVNVDALIANDSRWDVDLRGDAVLADVRLGRLDLTHVNYVPRSDRLANISVISAPLLYSELMAVVNRDAAVSKELHDWNHIFSVGTWLMILAWLMLSVFAIPKLQFIECRSVYALRTLSSIYSFYVQNLFIQALVASLVLRIAKPFTTFDEASKAVNDQRLRLVFSRFYPGWASLPGIHLSDAEIVQNPEAMLSTIAANRDKFTVKGRRSVAEALVGAPQSLRGRLYSYPLGYQFYAVSFCAKYFPFKEKVTLGYLSIFEAGNVETKVKRLERYFIGHLIKPPTARQLRPTALNTVGQEFCYWIGVSAACVVCLLVEALTQRICQIWHYFDNLRESRVSSL